MAETLGQHTALPPELFAQIKAIELRARRLATDMFAGEYESAFKGRGMRFEQVREYQPGDDVRHIDWNVTARMRAPFIKEFREERELTVMLLVDVSSSGSFGSGDKFKNEVAAEVAAILAYTAIKSHDRVGLIIFSDRIEHTIVPKKGRAHVWRVIRDILSHRPQRRGTRIGKALLYLGQLVRQRSVAFLISDFMDAGYADALMVASRRHDITAISMTDPRERQLPNMGLLQLQDCETGDTVLVDTASAKVRAQFAADAAAHEAQRDATLLAAGIPQIVLRSDAPYVDPIINFFRAQKRSRAR
jgi:uncharacterized protein (DUF58 family)